MLFVSRCLTLSSPPAILRHEIEFAVSIYKRIVDDNRIITASQCSFLTHAEAVSAGETHYIRCLPRYLGLSLR